MEFKLFGFHESAGLKMFQRKAWNNVVSIFCFESCFMDGRMELLLKIGNYSAFLKDLSFSEYFKLKRNIFSIEMSLSKKTAPKSIEIKDKKKKTRGFLQKRKSNSSKDIPKHRS